VGNNFQSTTLQRQRDESSAGWFKTSWFEEEVEEVVEAEKGAQKVEVGAAHGAGEGDGQSNAGAQQQPQESPVTLTFQGGSFGQEVLSGVAPPQHTALGADTSTASTNTASAYARLFRRLQLFLPQRTCHLGLALSRHPTVNVGGCNMGNSGEAGGSGEAGDIELGGGIGGAGDVVIGSLSLGHASGPSCAEASRADSR
jgi:hypothetical protein